MVVLTLKEDEGHHHSARLFFFVRFVQFASLVMLVDSLVRNIATYYRDL